MTAVQRISADPRRRAMLGKVHLAKKELGLDDDTYRALLGRVANRASAADCTETELGRVLDEFKAKGWKPTAPTGHAREGGGAPAPADHPVAGKARALWISLHQLGAVRDPGERALEAFGRRQLKVERLQWADQAQGYRLIEALKAMALRAGWDASEPEAATGAERLHAVKVQLVKAQWARLGKLGVIRGGEPPVCLGLANWAARNGVIPGVRSVESWTDDQLTAAAQRLGLRICKASPTGGAA